MRAPRVRMYVIRSKSSAVPGSKFGIFKSQRGQRHVRALRRTHRLRMILLPAAVESVRWPAGGRRRWRDVGGEVKVSVCTKPAEAPSWNCPIYPADVASPLRPASNHINPNRHFQPHRVAGHREHYTQPTSSIRGHPSSGTATWQPQGSLHWRANTGERSQMGAPPAAPPSTGIEEGALGSQCKLRLVSGSLMEAVLHPRTCRLRRIS